MFYPRITQAIHFPATTLLCVFVHVSLTAGSQRDRRYQIMRRLTLHVICANRKCNALSIAYGISVGAAK
jgi:hypothetical protein